jgi:hypothetical protein
VKHIFIKVFAGGKSSAWWHLKYTEVMKLQKSPGAMLHLEMQAVIYAST